jgi:Flp pilus assembly protein TadD
VDGAIAALEKSIAIQPEDGRAYYVLGIAYDKKGVKDKAREAYQTADRLQQVKR